MVATPANQGIRKAAIFVASLDRAAADLVLDQMQAEQAQAVRQAIMDLDALDPREQGTIIAEFRRVRSPAAATPPGVDLDAGLAQKFAPPLRPAPSLAGSRPSAPPFRFLRDAEIDKLVRVLIAERPQTIALVLAHLPPQHAGDVLARLEPELQVDVVRRLVDLEEADPEILGEVERGLQSRLSEQVQMQRRRVAGLAAVAGILDACDHRVGTKILDNLNAFDRPLAEKLGPPPAEVEIDFADLAGLPDQSLAVTLRAADAELILLALVGATPVCVERFLSLVPEADARQVRHELTHLGPTRLSDVEEARERLAELARQLAVEGQIAVPGKTRFLAEVV